VRAASVSLRVAGAWAGGDVMCRVCDRPVWVVIGLCGWRKGEKGMYLSTPRAPLLRDLVRGGGEASKVLTCSSLPKSGWTLERF
jgi:hypothetical protein